MSDELCRAVIFVGIPYPPAKDPKIVEKKNYQDQLAKEADNNYDNELCNQIATPINGQ